MFGGCQGEVLVTQDVFRYTTANSSHSVSTPWDRVNRLEETWGRSTFRIEIEDVGSFDIRIESEREDTLQSFLVLVQPLVP